MAVEVAAGAHVVQFYGHEGELTDLVGDYLVDALASDGMAIVIATEPHRRAFEAAVADAGIDVDAARRDGALVVLDAAETLARFVSDGVPNASAFDDTVGEVIRSAAATGRRVRAYGEMVALLWDDGLVNAAIDVEELWNGLASHVPFSLLCAYPSQSVAGDTHAEALEDVCRLHTGVVGGDEAALHEASRRFAESPAAPAQARRYVVETLERWGRSSLAPEAAAVVTELATNAVVHARSDFVVALRPSADGLRLSVRDRSPAAPMPREAGSEEPGGRGLVLVAAFSNAWGTEPAGDGKVVWAEWRDKTPVV